MYSISGLNGCDYEDFIKESEYSLYKIPQKGVKLLIGSKCNDGRPITDSWRYQQALRNGAEIISIQGDLKNLGQFGDLKEVEEKIPFATKYSPKAVNDIIGHKEQIKTIRDWLTQWNNGYPENRGILVSGPPGVGKTTTIHLVVKEFGYSVAEYNASDSRSISALRGMIQLGMKRLKKELIVMDEIDGISERGAIGELAGMIKKICVPIICICNEKSPKLKPILGTGGCLDLKFNRPMKSTISTWLYSVAKKEKLGIDKNDLEILCEQNGNDIRSILNGLEFYKSDTIGIKDGTLRMDAFSATQKLMSGEGKRMRLDEAGNLVFVDYSMIPLMISESYIASSKGSLDDVIRASSFVGFSDIIDKRIHRSQDWTLLPHLVQSVVSTSRTVSGPAPFQIFPQWLGKYSKRLKHKRWISDISQRMHINQSGLRMDYLSPLQQILLNKLNMAKPDYKGLIKVLDDLRLTRDDLMDAFADLSLNCENYEEKIEIPTKVKTAFTREYNKVNSGNTITKKKGSSKKLETMGSDSGSDSEVEDLEDLDEDIEELFGLE